MIKDLANKKPAPSGGARSDSETRREVRHRRQNQDDRLTSVYHSSAHYPMRYPSRGWTIKQLLHPILFSIIIPTYYIFGKYLLAFLRIVRGVGLAVSASERRGEKPDMFPARMPEALVELALHQFNKLERYNEHRREIAKIYYRELSNYQLPPQVHGAIYLRFNIRHHCAKEIIQAAKKEHILLGDWYKNILDPIGTDFVKMQYTQGSCPNAEQAARESVNLPTHINISLNDAKKIVGFFVNAVKSKTA